MGNLFFEFSLDTGYKMKKLIVKLAHIDGLWPFDEKVVAFSDHEISIGRQKESNLFFPSKEEFLSISRNHAVILREGNRYKIIDSSSHGTFVNGKKIEECYLNQGDVIVFSDNITKIGFNIEERDPHGNDEENSAYKVVKKVATPKNNVKKEIHKTVKANLHIQFGLHLKSWDSLPVVIGRNSNCDCVLDHPSVLDHHARIYFSDNHYYIEDLTDSNLITKNEAPVEKTARLESGTKIAFSPTGPEFLFSDGGSLIEIEKQTIEEEKAKIANTLVEKDTPPQTKSKMAGIFETIRKKLIR